MPKIPKQDYYDNPDGIVLPLSAENRFQAAARNVFGIGKPRIGENLMTKPAPSQPSLDVIAKKRSKVVPQVMTAAMRG